MKTSFTPDPHSAVRSPKSAILHCSVAPLRDSTLEIRDFRPDPYAAPIHRRIDALLLLFCLGICATLFYSAYAKHRSLRNNSATPGTSGTVSIQSFLAAYPPMDGFAVANAKHRGTSHSSANEQDRAVTLVSGK